jgi:hypothetical protein
MLKPLLIKGLHGLGDNLHQRALIRQLITKRDVYLESSWVAPYHDLLDQGLKVIRAPIPLYAQTKNAQREAARFYCGELPIDLPEATVWYRPEDVRLHRGVLAAMCAGAGVDYTRADFRLPVPDAWLAKADALIEQWRPTKPIMVVRPLVERAEWDGCAARNPDHAAYAAILASIHQRFFIVMLADLQDGIEWMVGQRIRADVALLKGELTFEVMAALFARAALVYCSPGFAVVLAQAVGTPVICVFGHYERAYSFSGGARFTPYLGIEPIHPRDDFSHADNGDKRIDLALAIHRARPFANHARVRPVSNRANLLST